MRHRKRIEGESVQEKSAQERAAKSAPNFARHWAVHEDEFLLGHAALMTDAQIAKALGRSRVGVLSRRLKWLDLQKTAAPVVWSEEDDSMLRALYGAVDSAFLAAMLDRPLESLWARAFYLRLRSRRAWLPEEDEILLENFPRLPVPQFAALLPGRTDRTIYHRAKVLSLERSEGYVLSSWEQRHYAYPRDLRSLIRLQNIVLRKLKHVEAKH